jgi:tRNA synthetases class II (D, K and N)
MPCCCHRGDEPETERTCRQHQQYADHHFVRRGGIVPGVDSGFRQPVAHALGIGEIIGGSQREERLAVLDERMVERGIDREHYAWYRDLRRYGTVPHAGFGLGFERTLAYVTGLANVRDAIPFPRTPGNARY